MPIHLVLDWDSTLTRKDTLHLVAAIGYSHNWDKNLTPWDDIVKEYLQDYAQHAESYLPETEDRRTIAEESDWLASLKDVEERSTKRVEDAGVFEGVTLEDISKASASAIKEEKLQLRNGWRQLLTSVREPGEETSEPTKVSILSVNWSGSFIRECLRTAISLSQTQGDFVDSIPICANEIHTPAPNIQTSADKLSAFNKIRDNENKTLYLGDSATDFDCLLAADVGICVRDESMSSSQRELKETFERVGVKVQRLGPEAWKANEGELERSTRRTVWWVYDLLEAVQFIQDRDSGSTTEGTQNSEL